VIVTWDLYELFLFWNRWYQIMNGLSGCSSKINADLNAVGDGDRSDFFHLSSCALKIYVSLENCHFPVIPCFRSLTTWRSSAADTQMFVGESDWSWYFNSLSLGVAYKLVGDLLNSVQFIAAEGYSGSFDFLILNSFLFSIFVSHSVVI